ncbi:orf97 [Pediococcus damnosus]|uniref:hypothetical protein n=1 Tax=Pediococcus damnosus TaxID=51663 RepID=UPI00078D4F89|nr:hypothetical protein [Pediococcus damnosus]AMV65207.1 orf97 [Pediococcus damnosus]
MAEIASFGVDVDKNTKLAQSAQQTADKAQSAADNAAGGVANLNDPNLMNVIEKQYNIAQFSGLTSQYSVIIQNAKDDGIDTTALTTAYNNLNRFMASVLAGPNHASDVDRAIYKKYQDAYNQELAKIQNALQSNVNNKFASAANAESQAASTASQAFSAADSAFSYANSEIAVQSSATDKAQSAADSAFSQAKTAINNGQVTSKAVTALKDGSTLTIAQLGNGLATKVSNSEYATYKTQTDSQVAQMVTSGAFTAYSQATAELISAKAANKDFSAYQGTTAKAISSKVESKDFNTYKEQTDGAILSKVNNGDFTTYTTQTANDINLRVTKGDLLSQINMQAGKALISASHQLTLSSNNINFDTTNPVIIPSANIDTLLVDKKLTAADISANTFTTNNGTFTVNKYGAVTASNLTIRGVTNLVYNAALLGGNGNVIPGWSISGNGCYWPGNIHDGVPSIGWNGTTGGWNLFAQTKLHPLNGTTGQPFSASVWFSDFGSDTSLTYQLTLAFFDSNGNRIDGASVGSTWNGTGSAQDWRYVTIDNVVAPSNAVSVGLQYWSGNGHGNAEFSSPMLTQTSQATGYQPDVGNVISAGEIDGSVINGAVINTPVLNLGDNGQLTGSYSVHDPTGYFQPINGTGSLQISHGYIQSTANIIYYNKLLTGIGGDKWGHWESSTQFIPAPDQAHPDAGNVAESTLTPAFLKLDIFNADKSLVKSRAYVDGTGLYINSGGTESIVSMLSGYELLSNGMAYLNAGIQMKQDASFTFGNLAMNGYHTIAMLDGKAINFDSKPGHGNIEVIAKTFTKSSRLSIKHDVTPLSTAESSRLLNAIDVEKFRYTHDGATYKYQYGGVIDDVNNLGSKQYSMPSELLNEDGTGINLDSLTGILIKRVQDQDKMIGKLSMRLTKLEMEK